MHWCPRRFLRQLQLVTKSFQVGTPRSVRVLHFFSVFLGLQGKIWKKQTFTFTLPETNSSPLKYSNHPFSGAMLDYRSEIRLYSTCRTWPPTLKPHPQLLESSPFCLTNSHLGAGFSSCHGWYHPINIRLHMAIIKSPFEKVEVFAPLTRNSEGFSLWFFFLSLQSNRMELVRWAVLRDRNSWRVFPRFWVSSCVRHCATSIFLLDMDVCLPSQSVFCWIRCLFLGQDCIGR